MYAGVTHDVNTFPLGLRDMRLFSLGRSSKRFVRYVDHRRDEAR